MVGLNIQGIPFNNTQSALMQLKSSGFIDIQTRSIVVDFVMFNSYTNMFTMITFISLFEPNGLLTTSIKLYNLKRYYYVGLYGAFRLLCEALFFLLLLLYIILKINEVRGEINQGRKALEKKQLKEARRNTLFISDTQKKKNGFLHYCQFLAIGLKQHYSNAWNWIDTGFLTLSTIAICIWSSIMYQHMTRISPLSLTELNDVTKNEIFFVIAFRMEVYV